MLNKLIMLHTRAALALWLLSVAVG